MDEVWNAIKANQTQPNYEQPFTVGHLLEGIGVGMSESPREPMQAAHLHFMQQFSQPQPELRHSQVQQARLPDPPQLQIHSQGPSPSFSPAQYAAQQRQLNARPALLQHQQLSSQQFAQPQYIQHQPPHSQQFRQPLPIHQQSQQPPQSDAQRQPSPSKSRGSSKGSPHKAQAVDSVAVNIRANSQYPPAQQACHSSTLILLGYLAGLHATHSLHL